MADAIERELDRPKKPGELFNAGFFPSEGRVDFASTRLEQLYRDSILGDLVGQAMGRGPSEYQKVFTDPEVGIGGKAAYVSGRVVHDIISDGSRIPYWFLNHPLAATSAVSEVASVNAGLSPNYAKLKEKLIGEGKNELISREYLDRMWARENGFIHPGVDDGTAAKGGVASGLARGVIPLASAMALIQASGNHDLLNLAGGGRTAGYQAVLPAEGNNKETTNAPLELALRYIAGRSGRLLPWEEFTEERPEVSRDDYVAARNHQFEKGLFNVGLVKGTGRNLEGEPEFTMMGFRVPFSGAATALGAMTGGAVGANVANDIIGKAMDKRRVQDIAASSDKAAFLSRPGSRRILGALAGSVVGGLTSNVASRLVNDAIIQPTFFADRVAAEEAWQRDALKRSILAKQAEAMGLPSPPPPRAPTLPPPPDELP